MFRISHVLGAHREHDRRRIAEVHALLSSSFESFAKEPEYITRKLVDQTARGVPAILLIAHGARDHVAGFALADYFEAIGYGYLDFIVTREGQRGRGLGGALYEALREDLTARGARG